MDKKKIAAIAASAVIAGGALGIGASAAVKAAGQSAEQDAIEQAAACKTTVMQLIDDITDINDTFVAMNYKYEGWDLDKEGDIKGNKLTLNKAQALSAGPNGKYASSNWVLFGGQGHREQTICRLSSPEDKEGIIVTLDEEKTVSDYNGNSYQSKLNSNIVKGYLANVKSFIEKRTNGNDNSGSWEKTEDGYACKYQNNEIRRNNYDINIGVEDGKIVSISHTYNQSTGYNVYSQTYNFKYLSQEEYNNAFDQMRDVITSYNTTTSSLRR